MLLPWNLYANLDHVNCMQIITAMVMTSSYMYCVDNQHKLDTNKNISPSANYSGMGRGGVGLWAGWEST